LWSADMCIGEGAGYRGRTTDRNTSKPGRGHSSETGWDWTELGKTSQKGYMYILSWYINHNSSLSYKYVIAAQNGRCVFWVDLLFTRVVRHIEDIEQ